MTIFKLEVGSASIQISRASWHLDASGIFVNFRAGLRRARPGEWRHRVVGQIGIGVLGYDIVDLEPYRLRLFKWVEVTPAWKDAQRDDMEAEKSENKERAGL